MLRRLIKLTGTALVCAVVLAGAYALTTRLLPASTAAPLPAPVAAEIFVETVARGLDHPWSLAFLPDGRMLVTERPGRLRFVTPTGEVSAPIAGVPAVAATGQGGLLDVVLDPDYATSHRIWLSYSEPREGASNGTAVASAVLGADRLAELRVVFRQQTAQHSPGFLIRTIVGPFMAPPSRRALQ